MKTVIGKRKDDHFVKLPTEVVEQLGWALGDLVEVDVVDGALVGTRVMTKHDRAMAIARRGMAKYRKTFEALAKT